MQYKIIDMKDQVNRFVHTKEANFKVYWEGSKYNLPVQKFVQVPLWEPSEYEPLPMINGKHPFVFQTRCWWAEGLNWWIGARYSTGQPDDMTIEGPFESVDSALVYLKLRADAK